MANLYSISILALFLWLKHASAQVELSECVINNYLAVAQDPSATPAPCPQDSSSSLYTEEKPSSSTQPAPAASTSPPSSPGSAVTTQTGDEDDPHCTCVTYYLCADNFGEGTIQIKADPGPPSPDTCPHYMDVCCYNEVQEPPVKINTTEITPTNDPWTCGMRNPEGTGVKIIGFDNEANYGEFPWMVAVLHLDEVDAGVTLKVMDCGGSIIHPQVVLTAAHCVKGKQNLLIRAGEWDAQTDKELYPIQERKVSEMITHEDYYGGALFNDIALLVLDTPLESSPVVGTICLPEQRENMDNRHCLSSGWGKDGFGKEGKYQTILKRVPLDIVTRKTCQEELRKTRLGSNFTLHPTFICAGGKKGEDTCKGDGGGPLVCPSKDNPNIYVQAGIVAWGIDCGSGNPSAYVNLPLYRNWIDEQLNSLVTALKISDVSKKNVRK